MPWRGWRARIRTGESGFYTLLVGHNPDGRYANIVTSTCKALPAPPGNQDGTAIRSNFASRFPIVETLVEDSNVQRKFGLDADLEAVSSADQKDVPSLSLRIGHPLSGIVAFKCLEKKGTQIALPGKRMLLSCSLPHPANSESAPAQFFTISYVSLTNHGC